MEEQNQMIREQYPEMHRQLGSRDYSTFSSFDIIELKELREGKCLQVIWRMARRDMLVSVGVVFGGVALGLASLSTLLTVMAIGVALLFVVYQRNLRSTSARSLVLPGPQTVTELGGEAPPHPEGAFCEITPAPSVPPEVRFILEPVREDA